MMRACLKLYTESSEHSVFWQMLKNDINISVGDSFEYGSNYQSLLDSQALEEFNRAGLTCGDYIVDTVKVVENEYWGTVKYIFLKPIQDI